MHMHQFCNSDKLFHQTLFITYCGLQKVREHSTMKHPCTHGGSMSPGLRRFGEEFFLYSSQFVTFFIFILFIVPGTGSPGPLAAGVLGLFLVVQTILLGTSGHLVLLRFVYSLITPLGYSLTQWVSGNFSMTEMATVFLWGSALYSGLFQTAAISARSTAVRRASEGFLAFGSSVLFVFFYYYINLRIDISTALGTGTIDRISAMKALDIQSFPVSFSGFILQPQHWFPAFATTTFAFMLLGSRQRIISLAGRIDKLFSTASCLDEGQHDRSGSNADTVRQVSVAPSLKPAEPAETGEFADFPPPPLPSSPGPDGTEPLQMQDQTRPVRVAATIISSDILGFTELAERLGPERAVKLLNQYYSLWSLTATRRGGRLISITGDTAILVFGGNEEGVGAEAALDSATAFMEGLEGLRNDLAASGYPATYRVSIGIHTGTIILARLGPGNPNRTGAFGDAIAVAARLDSLCRELKQELVVSQTTFSRLGLEGQSGLESMGEVLLPKSTHPVPVYGIKQKHM